MGIVALLLLVAAPLAAVPRLEPCHVDGVRESVRCGSVQVPEIDGGDRVLELRVVILPATRPDPPPDPLVVLAGGPGQTAGDLAGKVRQAFVDIHENRDIVLIDQRGTGGSNPLHCGDIGVDPGLDESSLDDPGLDEPSLDARPSSGAGETEQAVRSCLESLSERADLTAYSTYHAADDLERVRQAFGWPQVNLWGGSYGGRLALVYLDRHPDRVRSMVLDSASSYEQPLPLTHAASAQRAFDLLADDCAADPACRVAFPDPRADLQRLMASLDVSSGTARSSTAGRRLALAHPRTGAPIELPLTRESVASAVRFLLQDVRSASLLPHLLRRAAEGDWAPLLAAGLTASSAALEGRYFGSTYSVLCSEDVPRIDLDEIAAATAGSFMGRAEVDAVLLLCEAWPKTDLPSNYERIGSHQTPALLFSGALDPVTPPERTEAALDHLPRGRHLTVPGAGHIASFSGCAPRLISEFLDSGTAEGAESLDASCLESLRRSPFVLSAAGPALSAEVARETAGGAP